MRALLALSVLCEDSNDTEVSSQLSIKMVNMGVLLPLTMNVHSSNVEVQKRALQV